VIITQKAFSGSEDAIALAAVYDCTPN